MTKSLDAESRIKILIYSHDFLPLVGGVQSFIDLLCRGFLDFNRHEGGAGHGQIDVNLATATPADGMDDSALPYRIVRRPGFWRLFRMIRGVDIVHLAGPATFPLALALLLRKPVVIEHHGFQTACPNGLLFFEPTKSPCPGYFMAKRYGKCLQCNRESAGAAKSLYMLATTPIRRILSNWAERNVTPTDWLKTVLQLKRMQTIYHGVPATAGVATGQASASSLAYQGRLNSTKGVQLLIEAVENCLKAGDGITLKVIGDGPELESLKHRAAALKDHITFLGHVPDSGLETALADAGSIAMPSLGGEVFGLVAAENMHRGKLLIVSDVGALREVVGETGLVFRAGDVNDLASCMQKAASDPELAAALGKAARARAIQMFGRDAMIQGHISLYREILQEPH